MLYAIRGFLQEMKIETGGRNAPPVAGLGNLSLAG
jgi:hypothetical protein